MNKRIKRPSCDSVLNNHSYSLEFSNGRFSQYYNNYDTLSSVSNAHIIFDYDTLACFKFLRKYLNNLRAKAYYKKITIQNKANRDNSRLIDYAW